MAEWVNQVKRRLKAGEPQIGTWMTMPGVHYALRLGLIGFDWLMVDTEHSPTDVQGMAEAVAILHQTPTTPFVRVHRGTLEDLKRALDCGAWGVMSPMVNSAAEARDIVAWSKYPPVGARSAGAYAVDLLGIDTQTYVNRANEETMVMVQIESAEAVNRVEEIVSVPGIDCAFIGPGDLSISLGLPVMLDNTHPVYLEATQRVLGACRRHGVATGVMVSNAADANRAIERGFRMISIAADVSLITRLFADELGKVRR